MTGNAPDVAFLGLCEKAIHIKAGHALLWKHNIIGLLKGIAAYIYPLGLNHFQLAFAIYDIENAESARISVVAPNGEEIIGFDLSPSNYQKLTDLDQTQTLDSTPGPALTGDHQANRVTTSFDTFIVPGVPGWSFFVHDLKEYEQAIVQPGEYQVSLKRGDTELSLGVVTFVYVQAPPLTPERINAIRSNPFASKEVRLKLGCKICKEELRVYTALEQNVQDEFNGWLWYDSLSDSFQCKCGTTVIDLTMIRENMHVLLGNPVRIDDNVSFEMLYNKGTLEAIYNDFTNLLAT